MCRAQISETILTQPELLLENSATVSPLKKKVMDSLDENGNEKEVSEDSLTCSSAAVSNNNVRWFYSGYKGMLRTSYYTCEAICKSTNFLFCDLKQQYFPHGNGNTKCLAICCTFTAY